jgi:uroporphyrinogen-III decarboxylase
MIKRKLTSRQRMLAALNHQEPDHTPCSFMLYGGLKSICNDYEDFIERQLGLGLDVFVELPPRPPVVVNDHYNLHGLPVSYDPRVKIREWQEDNNEGVWPVLVKEYETPAGILRAEVFKTEDWRWGNHIPFLDDYIIPRSRKYLVTREEDLEPLRYLLTAPTGEEVAEMLASSKSALSLANRKDLLVAGGWGVGADLIGWICGLENMIHLPYDQPEFFRSLLGLIADWNRKRMEVLVDTGIDLYIKRAWYENVDFFAPYTWREFIFPILRDEVDFAHERGTKVGYIITSSCMPLLDMIVESGVDVLIGVDPMQWDLPETKRKLGGKVCLWGGATGHITVEQGTPGEVRAEVRRAMKILAPGGDFILSPVDNVRENTPRARENVRALIDEWSRLTGQ